MALRVVRYEQTSGWSSKASVGVERRRGVSGLKPRGGRRETTANVLEKRRSPRERGRMGTSVQNAPESADARRLRRPARGVPRLPRGGLPHPLQPPRGRDVGILLPHEHRPPRGFILLRAATRRHLPRRCGHAGGAAVVELRVELAAIRHDDSLRRLPALAPDALDEAHDVHAVDDAPEHDVLAVEPLRLRGADEELRVEGRGGVERRQGRGRKASGVESKGVERRRASKARGGGRRETQRAPGE
eukprot:30074-Pelagococcus_subviridis.AAC.2